MNEKQQLGTIASHVLKALGFFRDLETPLNKLASSSESANTTSYIDLKTQLENDFLRFKMWAGNQAAHQTGPSSLDHRLREAPHLHEQVIYLLKDICESLQDAISLSTEDFPSLDGDGLAGEKQEEQNTESSPYSLNNDDDDDSDFSDLDSDFPPRSGLSMLFADVGESIDCLLRLSVAIANPAPHERFRKLGAGLAEDVSFYGPHDIAYVKDKFPHIGDGLAGILGNFITRRRQFFKYRRAHHTRLASNLESVVSDEKTDTSRTEIVQKTVASSLPEHFKAMANFDPRANLIDEDVRSDTGISQTSYATSAGFLIENQDDQTRDLPPPLRVPPMPNAGEDGIFECPFCYRIIAAKSRAAWKRHIFGDLRPFTCLFSQCTESNIDFDRRHNWQLHVSKYHWSSWHCPFKCEGLFPSATELALHVKAKHLLTGDEQELRTVVSLGERVALTDTANQCPVCGSTVSGLKKYVKHVGRHLEQLALFALPRLEEQSPEEDAASDEQISAQSSLDVSSKSSSQPDCSMLERRRMPLPDEEKDEENASLTGDDNSVQGAYLVQARAKKWPETLGSASEDSRNIGNSTAMQKTSMTKVVGDALAWFRYQVAYIVAPKIELVERLEIEAGRLNSASAEGLLREDSIGICEQITLVLRRLRRVDDELKSFPESHDLSELSPEEATQLLEMINDNRKKLKTTLEEAKLRIRNLKVNGMDQTEVSHTEDTGEIFRRLADLEGEVPDSLESSTYTQPLEKTAPNQTGTPMLAEDVAQEKEGKSESQSTLTFAQIITRRTFEEAIKSQKEYKKQIAALGFEEEISAKSE
ncbi:hypothetical protein KAF25_006994 [Fusarium avenaceum]|uniref:C2H2-type domain-containing protein n=1 Tax=Fusarium avenaceum TaxID=40199 RepID=A0A9P7GXG3_9HYPO|nr:hypothetical protein KAF25_006994 [Fusarium avenaceum]